MLTIRQTLEEWATARVATLKQVGAPQEIIDNEERGDFSYIHGIEKYGDLEVESHVKLNPDDPGLAPLVLFNCKPIQPVLLFTQVDDTVPPRRVPGQSTYPSVTKLVPLEWSL